MVEPGDLYRPENGRYIFVYLCFLSGPQASSLRYPEFFLFFKKKLLIDKYFCAKRLSVVIVVGEKVEVYNDFTEGGGDEDEKNNL